MNNSILILILLILILLVICVLSKEQFNATSFLWEVKRFHRKTVFPFCRRKYGNNGRLLRRCEWQWMNQWVAMMRRTRFRNMSPEEITQALNKVGCINLFCGVTPPPP